MSSFSGFNLPLEINSGNFIYLFVFLTNLEKKIQELEKIKAETIEVKPPQEISEPQEFTTSKEVSGQKN